jgi:hypothetical protein
MNYEKKYLKYKSKYLNYKTQFGGNNRFTLIIKRRYDNTYYWYNYYIIDNLKPSNIYTFEICLGDAAESVGKSFFVDSRDSITCDNIVAYYFDQTMLKTSDGGYVGINWPKKLSEPIFRGTLDDENKKYRLENMPKFGEKILEIKMKKENKEIFFPYNPNELLRINFD